MDIGVISLLVSIVTLAFAMITYFAHDRKLKKQQKLLNELNIEKLKTESQEQQKADVRAILNINQQDVHISSISNGFQQSGKLNVTNFGKSYANNIRIKAVGFDFSSKIESLAPNESRNYNVEWYLGYPRGSIVTITWDDDFAKNRRNEIKLL